MAKKKDNTGLLIGVGLFGFAVYSIMNRPRFTPNPTFPNMPAEPPRGTPQWLIWVNAVIQLAGGISQQLFAPNGPFAQWVTEQQLMNEVDQVAGEDVVCYDPHTGLPTAC